MRMIQIAFLIGACDENSKKRRIEITEKNEKVNVRNDHVCTVIKIRRHDHRAI